MHLYANVQLSLPHLSPCPFVHIEDSITYMNGGVTTLPSGSFQPRLEISSETLPPLPTQRPFRLCPSCKQHFSGADPHQQPWPVPQEGGIPVSLSLLAKWTGFRAAVTNDRTVSEVLAVRNLKWLIPKWRSQQG